MKQEHRVPMQVFRLAGRENEVGARRCAKADDLDIPVVPVNEKSDSHRREAVAAAGLLDHECLLRSHGSGQATPYLDEGFCGHLIEKCDRVAAKVLILKEAKITVAKPEDGDRNDRSHDFEIFFHRPDLRQSGCIRQLPLTLSSWRD